MDGLKELINFGNANLDVFKSKISAIDNILHDDKISLNVKNYIINYFNSVKNGGKEKTQDELIEDINKLCQPK